MIALFDIERWLDKGGLALFALIVFAESGLFIGFFLPGDSLLFVAGFLSSDAGNNLLPALPITAGVAFVAAVVGDQVGYAFGHKVGPALFDRPQSRLFNPANLAKAHLFFERRGPTAIVLARFVPIVRTFTPIVAGVAQMRYRTFVTYNIVGGLLWGVGVTTLGYFLGEIDFIKNNLEVAAVIIVAVSLLPVALEYRRHRRETAAAAAATSPD
ncbi:MAG: VTT domain-containing protein [Actinobacteria bacterium]|nr:VTT domain-containing protein [Actinomycetota bacterium]